MTRTWMVTGASRGLGLHIAKAALNAGDNVIATGRDLTSLNQALGSNSSQLRCFELDVTNSVQVRQVADNAIETFKGIHILVNNAGFGQLGPFETNSAEEARLQFDTNVFGLMEVCRAVLPSMRLQRMGHIFNIASIAGIQAMAGASIYCASKFAVMGFSESLAQEVKAYNIKVTAVAPGSFRTDFLDASSARFGSVEIPAYAEFSNIIKAGAAANNHAQSGDPAKLGNALVALALAEDAPVRFLAGSDALKSGTEYLQSALVEAERWKALSASTDT